MCDRNNYLGNKDNLNFDYIKKYDSLIIKKVRKYSTDSNLNFDDYLNDARYAIIKAKNKYSIMNSSLLNKIIDNSLNNYYRKTKNKCNIPLDEYVNIDDFSYLLSNKYDPEYQLYSDWSYYNFKSIIISKLTWKEELVLTLKEQNYSNSEISSIIDININKIYYINNQIKQKISKVLSS